MNELSISNQYPAAKYNLLGNTDVMVEVPDIKSPVIQVVWFHIKLRENSVFY